MKKVFGVIAALAIVGASGVANAADAQNDSVKQPAEISATDMDSVTAGLGPNASGTPVPRSYNLGSYSLVFNGTSWSLVRK